MSWFGDREVRRSEDGFELVVGRDVLRVCRGICLGCGKCKGGNVLKWRMKVEVVDGVDVWYMECEERRMRVYNLISGRLRGLLRNRRSWI